MADFPITSFPAVTTFSAGDIFEVESFLTSAFISSKISVENFVNGILGFAGEALNLDDGSGNQLNIFGDGSGGYTIQAQDSLTLSTPDSNSSLVLNGSVTIQDTNGNTIIMDGTNIIFSKTPVSPGAYTGTVAGAAAKNVLNGVIQA